MKKKALITGVHVHDVLSRKLINIDMTIALGCEYEYSSEAYLIKAYQWFVDNKNKFKS